MGLRFHPVLQFMGYMGFAHGWMVLEDGVAVTLHVEGQLLYVYQL